MRIAATLLAAAAALSAAGFAGGASTRVRLVVQPPVVVRGNAITLKGNGFKANTRVTIDIRSLNVGVRTRFGSVVAGRRGGFVFTKNISRTADAGVWVARACQQRCRVKAAAQFRVSKVEPL